jgi:hypothetical protein
MPGDFVNNAGKESAKRCSQKIDYSELSASETEWTTKNPH